MTLSPQAAQALPNQDPVDTAPFNPDPSGSGMTRRTLLAGAAATGAVASVGLRPATAAAKVPLTLSGPAPKSVVVIYLRGGVDGLSFLVPSGFADYHAQRPTIGITSSQSVALPGVDGWELHPRLAGLLPEWNAGNVAFIHGAGLQHPSRSHFIGQDLTESGTNDLSNDPTGWIGRYLAATDGPGMSQHRAIEVGAAPARSLSGYGNALALTDLESAGLGGQRYLLEQAQLEALEVVFGNQAMYGNEGPVHETMAKSLSLSREVQELNLTAYGPTPTPFDVTLSKVPALLASPLQVQVVSTTLARQWDTHASQGTATSGPLQRDFLALSNALTTYFAELANLGIADRVTTVLMTEFGRRFAENGNGGTDHGKGGLMMVHSHDVIGQVRSVDHDGAQLVDPSNPLLVEGGDVAVTTDYRHVLSAVAAHALPGANLASMFPEGGDYSNSPNPVELF